MSELKLRPPKGRRSCRSGFADLLRLEICLSFVFIKLARFLILDSCD